MVRTRRFDEIHEARQQVIDDERSLNEALATGRIDDSRARRLFQRAVDSYVRELEYLLNPPDSDEENKYWHTEAIGTVELADGRPHPVKGLGEYLDLPEELAAEIAVADSEHYYELPTQQRRVETVQPPWELLRSAFRTANAAVAELGMELDIESDDSDRWGFREIKDIDDIDPDEWENLSVADLNGHGAES